MSLPTVSEFTFRLRAEVIGLATQLGTAEMLEFALNSPRVIFITLGKPHPSGAKIPERSDAVCVATTTAEAPSAAIRTELRDGWKLPVVDGKINAEDPTTKFIDSIIGDLRNATRSTMTTLRWRAGIAEGPPDPCQSWRADYCEAGGPWHEVTLVRSVSLRFGLPGKLLDNDVCKHAEELVVAGSEEPLGRQLFREAWSQKDSRPRSALVIGVAAAEVGFKKLVGNLVPQAQWLVDEVQTPSLSKMLSKFLPQLPVRARFPGKSIRPPKTVLRALDHAVERRNKLVHAGDPPPSRDELEGMLRAINDFLWICDLYSGHVWAGQHISAAVQEDWPSDGQSER